MTWPEFALGDMKDAWLGIKLNFISFVSTSIKAWFIPELTSLGTWCTVPTILELLFLDGILKIVVEREEK